MTPTPAGQPVQTGSVTMGYLRREWGDIYALSKEGGTYRAQAVSGKHDVLTADSPAGLLAEMRRHYPGTKADLCST